MGKEARKKGLRERNHDRKILQAVQKGQGMGTMKMCRLKGWEISPENCPYKDDPKKCIKFEECELWEQ